MNVGNCYQMVSPLYYTTQGLLSCRTLDDSSFVDLFKIYGNKGCYTRVTGPYVILHRKYRCQCEVNENGSQ